MNNYISHNCHKYNLKYHLIFVCKYRKKLLLNNVDIFVKNVFQRIANESGFCIDIMETDKDHIHLSVSYPPNPSVSSIVKRLKQINTNSLWKVYHSFLKRHFWKEHTFWSDGYFACSIGEAHPDDISDYIVNQG